MVMDGVYFIITHCCPLLLTLSSFMLIAAYCSEHNKGPQGEQSLWPFVVLILVFVSESKEGKMQECPDSDPPYL